MATKHKLRAASVSSHPFSPYVTLPISPICHTSHFPPYVTLPISPHVSPGDPQNAFVFLQVGFNAKDEIFCRLWPDLVEGSLFTLPTEEGENSEEGGGTNKTASTDMKANAPPGGSGGVEGVEGGPLATAGGGLPATPEGGLLARSGAANAEGAAAREPSADDAHADETSPAHFGGDAPGGKNAARNRKKREKEREKARQKAAAAGGAAVEGGAAAEAAESAMAELVIAEPLERSEPTNADADETSQTTAG